MHCTFTSRPSHLEPRAELALKAGSSGLSKLVSEMRAQLQKLTSSDFTGHHLLQLKKQALVGTLGGGPRQLPAGWPGWPGWLPVMRLPAPLCADCLGTRALLSRRPAPGPGLHPLLRRGRGAGQGPRGGYHGVGLDAPAALLPPCGGLLQGGHGGGHLRLHLGVPGQRAQAGVHAAHGQVLPHAHTGGAGCTWPPA